MTGKIDSSPGSTEPAAATADGIVMAGINAYYGRHRALADISAAVPARSTLAILGRNGAGKTTLLRSLIGGFGVRVTGDVLIDGAVVTGLSADEVVRRHNIGFVPDDRRIFPLSVADNLRVAALGSRSWKSDAERVLALFPFLEQHLSQLATTMSGGEQQALAIARAAMRRPRYLLLDEPGEGLAPIAVQRLIDGLRRLQAEADFTLVLVERNMEMISALCDTAVGMSAGRIIWRGAVAELRAAPQLLEQILLPATAAQETGIGHDGG
jgi:branched-chain amino acid transport system ATP-binding protein